MAETKLDVGFFNELLKGCIVKKSFFGLIRNYLKVSYLPEGAYRAIWNELLSYVKKHDKVPTFGILRQRFIDKDDEYALDLLADIKDILKIDYDTILKEFEEFVKKSKFLESYSKIADIYNEGNKEAAYSKFKEAADELNSFSLKAEEGELLFSNFTRRHLDRVLDSKVSFEHINVFPSGIDLLDYHMDGGTKRGEGTLYLGDSGVGKSQLLIFNGISIARRGGRVLHLQAEGTKVQTMNRYDAAWTGTLYKDMKRGSLPEGKLKVLQKIIKKVGKGEVHIFCKDKFGSWSVPDVRHIAMEVIRKFGPIDAIIADYLELFDPGDGLIYRPNDERFRQTAVARGFINLSLELNSGFITATQATAIPPEVKDDPDKVLTRWHLSEDKGKIRPFDNFITLNQTSDEKKEQIMRLYGDKFRENSSGQIIKIQQALHRSRFYDRIRTIEELYNSEELEIINSII